MLLPATQGIYGFIIGLIASAQLKAGMDAASGWAVFAAVMPMAISGLISGFMQGKCAANCIYAVGKQESLSGKLIVCGRLDGNACARARSNGGVIIGARTLRKKKNECGKYR